MPRSSSARCRRAGKRTVHREPRGARHPQVRMPPERHRHLPVAGGHEHGVDHEPVVVQRDCDLEQVRERERGRVDDRRRGEACDVAPGARARHLPVGRTHQQAVDRQPVVVGVETQPTEVDVDTRGVVPARRQAVGPRRQQRQPARVPRSQRGDAAREREVLASVTPERHPGHAYAGHERGTQLAAPQFDRRRVLEAPLDDRRAHVALTSWARPAPGSRPCAGPPRTGAPHRA